MPSSIQIQYNKFFDVLTILPLIHLEFFIIINDAPLHISSLYGHFYAVKILLDQSNIQINKRNKVDI